MDANRSPPRVVEGKYAILDALPTHGSSRLFTARHAVTGRTVALREFTPVDGSVDEALTRLTRAGNLASRFVAELLDAARIDEQTLFVAHPLMTGESLVARLARKKSLDVHEAALVGARVLRGLEAIHARDLVHGGLRPSRVFHERSPKRGWHIKLLGAGVHSVTRDEMRRAPELVAYAPPEWLEGGAWTAACDLWCVGSILYTCLTGRTAYAGKTAEQVEQRVRAGEASPLVAPGASPELEALIMSALARDPGARPASARAFSEQLQALYPEPGADAAAGSGAQQERWTRGHFVGKPVPADPTSMRRRAPSTAMIRQKRRGAWQTAVAALMLACAVVLFIGAARAARDRQREPAAAGGTPPQAAQSPPPVAAPPPVVTAPAQDTAQSPSPAAAPSDAAAATSPVARPRVAPPSSHLAQRPPPPSSAPPVALVEGQGMLDFSSATMCRFMLDGIPRGAVTRTELTLPAGTHRIGCGVGREAMHLTVRIEPGRRTRVHANSVGDTEVSTETLPP